MAACPGVGQAPTYVDTRGEVTRGGCPVCRRNPRVTRAGVVGYHKAPTTPVRDRTADVVTS